MKHSFAIVGMSCQSSGIENLDDYWRVISQGETTLKRYSNDELERSGINVSDFNSSDYVPVGGDIKGADNFDAKFFGVPPKEALYMDPQHRKFLEETYHAFENAGINPESYEGLAGVFAGCSQNNYRLQNIEKTNAGQDWSEFQKQIASDKDFLATQVAYKLGLRGPALTIQTACSTSLVAVDTACKYLESGQCDLAVAGGAYINVPLQQGYIAMEGGILSASGECRAFDNKADGTIFSSAVGAVIIKRLEEALEDGDNIYGVIEGIATNNDGNKKVSYTAPGYEGQAEVITIAQAMADIDPSDIGYVEAHGTGTKLGDPLEVQALTNAFRLSTDNTQYCVLGSVKSNIGHCDVAAGIMGLIKACLCLTNKVYPPQINFDQINSEIDLEDSPFLINLTSQHWSPGPSGKRLAAVSSFGVGGTNAHAILSEPPKRKSSRPSHSELPVLIPISGKSPEAAVENAHQLGEFLRQNSPDVRDVAHSLSLGRAVFEYRDFVTATSTTEASEKLLAINTRTATKNFHTQNHKSGNLIFMFPGQGSQHINMAKELYEHEAVFRESMDECFGILSSILEYDLKQVLYPSLEETDFASDFLKHTEVAQPALFCVSYATAQLLISRKIEPDKMIGHSIGEYVAACLSGVFSLRDALRIVSKRGQLMQAMDSGSMLAVIADSKSVEAELTEDLSIAAINSPTITVVSGKTPAIRAFEDKLNGLSIRAVPLHTSHAFHSYMMDPMLESFIREFDQIELNTPQIPFVSCVTGMDITTEQCRSPEYWAKQVRNPVLFSKGILSLVENSQAICLEAGPSNALSSALSAHDFKDNSVLCYNTLPPAAKPDNPLSQLYSTFGNLWKSTGLLTPQDLLSKNIGRRIPLPGYAFKQARCWIDTTKNLVEEQTPDTNRVQTVGNATSSTGNASKALFEAKLKALLTELSGVEFTEDIYKSEFLSLGFESLLVAEIRGGLKSEFSLEIGIPQLLSNFNTFEKLLAHCISEIAELPAVDQNKIGVQSSLAAPEIEGNVVSPAAQNVSMVDVYNAIQEQSNLLRKLIEIQLGSASASSKENQLDLTDTPNQEDTGFHLQPAPDAVLGRDPEGQPHWYVPDPEKPGQYLLVQQ